MTMMSNIRFWCPKCIRWFVSDDYKTKESDNYLWLTAKCSKCGSIGKAEVHIEYI